MSNRDISHKSILFIKIGEFSHTNKSVLKILKSNYPDISIVVIDIWEDIFNFKSLSNVIYVLYKYNFKILRFNKKKLASVLTTNKYIFRKVKFIINKKIKKESVLFTFQTQSLYDASISGISNFVYTDHTFLENKKYPGTKKELLYNDKCVHLEKSIYQNAKMIFTMSTNITNTITNDYGIDVEKVKCVFAGSNVVVKNNLSDGRFYNKRILFVGVNWERKGGPILEKAFRKVLQIHNDAHLTIVGCTPDLDLNNCKIIGKVPIEEVQQYYEESSIFCLPTNIEPFGLVFLEAMANKLPVIATNIGAIPDFITEGKNGYMIHPGDVEMLVKKILILIENPEICIKFGEYGFNKIKGNYTWDKVGGRLKSHIDRSIKNIEV